VGHFLEDFRKLKKDLSDEDELLLLSKEFKVKIGILTAINKRMETLIKKIK